MLRARTHRGSEINRDEDLLLAMVSFLWRGIHSRSQGPREIREIDAQLLGHIREAKIVNQMFLLKPGAVRPRLLATSYRSCSSFLRICSFRLSGSWTGCKRYCSNAIEGYREVCSFCIPKSVIVSSASVDLARTKHISIVLSGERAAS